MSGPTMREVAERWVAHHRETCDREGCDCKTGDTETMVAALCEMWLTDRDDDCRKLRIVEGETA